MSLENLPNAVDTTPKHFWRVYAKPRKLVECSVTLPVEGLCTVTVVVGPETILMERYPDFESAMRRATEIRERLLQNGGQPETTSASES